MEKEKSIKQISHLVNKEGRMVEWFMRNYPTTNELFFINLLDENKIKYKFQKVFFQKVEGHENRSKAYYIAQFWLYKKRLFVEVNPGHRKSMKPTNFRVYDALSVFPRAQCIKLTDKDLKDENFMKSFISVLK